MALHLCNFQPYCIVVNRVKESSRRGDFTAGARRPTEHQIVLFYLCCTQLATQYDLLAVLYCLRIRQWRIGYRHKLCAIMFRPGTFNCLSI